jgi:hypothetical protein
LLRNSDWLKSARAEPRKKRAIDGRQRAEIRHGANPPARPCRGVGPCRQRVDESCVRDEKQALGQLQKQWSKFPAQKRAGCVSQNAIGGTPSYVGLLTCLQF